MIKVRAAAVCFWVMCMIVIVGESAFSLSDIAKQGRSSWNPREAAATTGYSLVPTLSVTALALGIFWAVSGRRSRLFLRIAAVGVVSVAPWGIVRLVGG
ncbi:MAG: hypothetical protein H7287_14295 [Thermoleophilia bacterium]|nr:hypothetical protein [Thermoleophilia bacterium]